MAQKRTGKTTPAKAASQRRQLDLSAAESELINEPGRELILKGLIAKLLDSRKFDYILIDCPPSLGLPQPCPLSPSGP